MDFLQAQRETERIAGNLYSRCVKTMAGTEAVFDWKHHFRLLGLNEDIEAGREPTLNFHQYYELLASIAPQLKDQDFYLSLGDSYDITDLGVLGYALISADNLRRSWALTFHTSSLLVHPLVSQRRVEHGRIIVELQSPGAAHETWRWALEEWLAGTWKWLRQRLPQVANSKLLMLNLAYPAPDYSARYKEIFPGEINFAEPKTELSFPEAWYHLPFPVASPTAAKACQQQYLLIMQQMNAQSDLVQSVRRKLLLNPHQPLPSLAEMALQFRLAPHTFHRKLKKEHISYQRIVTEVRMALAKDYLKNTALHLQEISYLLAYEHPPSFYRAFKKWVGLTPLEFRLESCTH